MLAVLKAMTSTVDEMRRRYVHRWILIEEVGRVQTKTSLIEKVKGKF